MDRNKNGKAFFVDWVQMLSYFLLLVSLDELLLRFSQRPPPSLGIG